MLGGGAQLVDRVLDAVVADHHRDGLARAAEFGADASRKCKAERAETDRMKPAPRFEDREYLIGGISDLRHVGGDHCFGRQSIADDGEYLAQHFTQLIIAQTFRSVSCRHRLLGRLAACRVIIIGKACGNRLQRLTGISEDGDVGAVRPRQCHRVEIDADQALVENKA